MLHQSLLLFVTTTLVCATTEWFGDLRAQLNPPRAPAFYDVTYDDSDCPQGLQSNAIPDYVYFGAMISTLNVREHNECLQHCVSDTRCLAVNFFEPMRHQEKGFCELLSETQFDNPRLMRPFRQAVYYEKIRCRTEEETDDAVNHKPVTVMNNATPKMHEEATAQQHAELPATPAHQQAHDEKPAADNNVESSASADNTNLNTIMKRLEAKVHEFNLRFRSRR